MKHKLTDTFAKNLTWDWVLRECAKAGKPAPKDREDIFDPTLPAFSLRLSKHGRKTWNVIYRVVGQSKPQRRKLGHYPGMTLADARLKAGRVQELRDAGKDPKLEAERERRQEATARATTVKAAAGRFYAEIGASEGQADRPKLKGRRKGKVLKTAKEVKRQLDNFLLVKFGDRPLGDVTRGELIALFDDIADQNGPIAANRALAWTKRFFKWAMSKYDDTVIAANPAADVQKPGEERKGSRVLNDDEIRDLWAAASALPYPAGHYVKALLLSGRRRTSVASMRRSEIKARVWSPSGGSANKQVPELPLSTALETLLTEAPDGGDYVFKTKSFRRHGDAVVEIAADRPLNSFTDIKNDLDAEIAKIRKARGAGAMPAWELQRDIRRTVKTRLAELGVEKEIRDLVMGHARIGMDAVYDHSERREDKRVALEKWAQHLAAILEPPPPSNVVDMQTRRA